MRYGKLSRMLSDVGRNINGTRNSNTTKYWDNSDSTTPEGVHKYHCYSIHAFSNGKLFHFLINVIIN